MRVAHATKWLLIVTIPLGIGYYAAHHMSLLGGKILARDCTASTTISTASRTIDYRILQLTARTWICAMYCSRGSVDYDMGVMVYHICLSIQYVRISPSFTNNSAMISIT